jgi:hypothetical protein
LECIPEHYYIGTVSDVNDVLVLNTKYDYRQTNIISSLRFISFVIN